MTISVRIGESNLNGKAGGDDAEQDHHKRLDPAEPQMLHSEDEKHIECRDDHADFQRNVEEKIETDGGADHFGEVGRADGDLSQQPKRPRHRAGKCVAAGLREIAPGGNPKSRTQRLQEDRHDVREERDDQERVAEL